MTRRKIDKLAISGEIEGLSISNLQKAYKRFRKRTRSFHDKNVRDPLDHIDFEVNLTKELEEIMHRVERGDYYPSRPLIHYSAKKNGISRPTVSMNIEDSVVFLFCLEQLDKELLEKVRNKNIRGGVMLTPTLFPADGDFYEHYFKDWMELMESIQESLKKHSFIATTDISSYFDNVDIEVLENLLRNSVTGKSNVLELLCFILQGVKLRYGYQTTLKTGLVQDDSDGSRLLAYFYLYQHDNRMMELSHSIKADYFRFADDMNITVKTEIDGKRALRTLSDSLRQLGLTASIEKTYITSSEEALKQMFADENEYLNDFERRLRDALDNGKDRRKFKRELKNYYQKLLREDYENKKNWNKLLKRFYTFATFLQDDFLFEEIPKHLITVPSLTTRQKMTRYFVANEESSNFGIAVEKLIDYLESSENLYPQTETEILELLCSLNLEANTMTVTASVRLSDYANRAVFGNKKRPIKLQSDFAKGICLFLLYKLDDATNEKMAQLYLNSPPANIYHKKCLILVSLTVKDSKLRRRLKNVLRTETDTELKRLYYMISNLDFLKNNSVIKKYKKDTDFILYFNKWDDPSTGKKMTKSIRLYSLPVRVKILRDILKLESR